MARSGHCAKLRAHLCYAYYAGVVGLSGFNAMEKFGRGLCYILQDSEGQDIAEYAIMLAVILVIVIGTVKLIGGNANNTFSNVASTLQ